MNRRPTDPHKAAEAVFKRTAPKVEDEPKAASLPGVKEQVSIRLDREVLDHFQADGPGWQDRINDALKKLIGK